MLVTTVAMRVESGWHFILNALTFVPELVNEVGRPARPWVVRIGDFSVVEASRRASLVRVETWSRCPVERVSYESEHGRPVGLFSLIVDCGCPLFLVPDNVHIHFFCRVDARLSLT
jgi:hypothetical protein